MKPQTRAIILLLFAGLLWSTGGVLIKTNDAHPFVISSLRGLFAAMVFFCALKGRVRFRFSKYQIIGACVYASTVTAAVFANVFTSAANAIMLQYTAPVFAGFLGFFILKEKLHSYDFAAMVGVILGMWLLMSSKFEGNSLFGNILALGAGLTFGLLAIVLRMLRSESDRDETVYETIWLGNMITFLVGLPFLFLYPPELQSLPAIGALGIFQIGLPYLLYTAASKHARAIDLTVIPVIEPLLNPVWVFLATGEFPGMLSVAGGILLLAVVVMKSVFSIRREDKLKKEGVPDER